MDPSTCSQVGKRKDEIERRPEQDMMSLGCQHRANDDDTMPFDVSAPTSWCGVEGVRPSGGCACAAGAWAGSLLPRRGDSGPACGSQIANA